MSRLGQLVYSLGYPADQERVLDDEDADDPQNNHHGLGSLPDNEGYGDDHPKDWKHQDRQQRVSVFLHVVLVTAVFAHLRQDSDTQLDK